MLIWHTDRLPTSRGVKTIQLLLVAIQVNRRLAISIDYGCVATGKTSLLPLPPEKLKLTCNPDIIFLIISYRFTMIINILAEAIPKLAVVKRNSRFLVKGKLFIYRPALIHAGYWNHPSESGRVKRMNYSLDCLGYLKDLAKRMRGTIRFLARGSRESP